MADNVIQNIGIKATADFGGATNQLKKFENDLDTLSKKLKESFSSDAQDLSQKQLIQGLNNARASLRSAEKDIVKYGNKMSQMWRNAKVDQASALAKIEAYSSALSSLEKQAGTMKINIWNENPSGTSNEKYPFGKEEEYTPSQYKYAPDSSGQINAPTQAIEETNTKTEETISKFSRLRAKIGEAFSQENLQNFSDKMSKISAKAGEISGKMGRVARTVGSAGKRFLSAINPMTMFRNEQNKLSLSSTLLGKAFSRLGRMFRIMVTRMLIRGFISNIREGFQNIAQYSDVVNQKFSSIIASAKTLYNAFASAFTPLIEAIAPYVVKALDFITSAMNRVAEFMSALTGKSYYIKATKYNYNYAKSLDKAGKSAGKTAKKVKELKSATIGIDKLNVIEKNQPDTSNSGAGTGAGGGGGASPSDMFDTKPVSKKMQKLAKEVKRIARKLFDPIQKAWNSKGAKVLSSFKKMLGSIWSTIKAIGRDFLKVWQQPATVKIFEDILETVSLIFDTIKAISDQFRKAWNKDNVGLHIFENLRDVIGIIVSGIKECIKYTKKWAQHLNFSPLLQSIERYTKSLKKLMKGLVGIASDFYKIVVLGISKWVVEKGLPALIQVFTDFNNKVDWQRLRKSIKVLWKGLEHLAETIGEGLINVLGDLMDALADLLNSKWFQNLIKAIGNLMKSIKPKYIEWFVKAWLGMKAIKFVSGIFGNIATKIGFVIGKIRWFKYSKVGGKLIGAFGNFFKLLPSRFGKLTDKIADFATTTPSLFSKLGTKLSPIASKLGGLFSKIGGASGVLSAIGKVAGKVVAPIGVFLAVTKAYEKTLDGGDQVAHFSKEVGKLVDNSSKALNKAKEFSDKWKENTDDIQSGVQTTYEKTKFYLGELKKITDENGKIKKGYEKQAEYLAGEINKNLGTTLKVSGGYVKNLKSANKQLKKMKDNLALTSANQVLEKKAPAYYSAKSKRDKALENYAKTQYEIDYGDHNSAEMDKLLKALNNYHKEYLKWDSIVIRYDNLVKAVAKNDKKAIKTALGNIDTYIEESNGKFERAVSKREKNLKNAKDVKDWAKYSNAGIKGGWVTSLGVIVKDIPTKFVSTLTKLIKKKKISFKKAVDFSDAIANAKYWGVKINTTLAEKVKSGKIDIDTAINYVNAINSAKEKGKDVSKYIGDGIFKNKGTVKKATDSLKALVNGIPSEKDTTVKVKGKGQYEKDSKDAGDSAKKNVPKKLETTIEIKAKLSAKKIGKRLKKEFKGYTLDQIIKGSGGKRYAIYENKKTGKKKKVLMANGGYPKLGSEFIAGEKGAEFVGNINGKTGVASNQEITGIRDSIESSSSAQNQILMEQNNLLRALLEKNTDIVLDGQKVTKRVNQINARSGYKMAT